MSARKFVRRVRHSGQRNLFVLTMPSIMRYTAIPFNQNSEQHRMISITLTPNLDDPKEGERIVAALQALYGLEAASAIRVGDDSLKQALANVVAASAEETNRQDNTHQLMASAGVPAVPPAPAAPPAPPAPPAVAAAPSSTVPVDASAFSATPVPTPPVPPVPATAAPSAPAATTSLAGGAELDAKGLPWDARIHSSTKAKNQDGTWRQMRGIEAKSPGLVAAVEAELRAAYPAPAGSAPAIPTPPVPPVPAAPAIPAPPVPAAPAIPAPPVPPASPVAPAIPVPPVPTGVVNPTTFMGMLEKVRQLVEESRMLSTEEVGQACQAVGLPGLLHLGAAAAIDPTVIARLDAEIERVLAS